MFPIDLQFIVFFCEKLENIYIKLDNTENSEVAIRICPAKKLPKKISENSQERTCGRVSLLIKLQMSCNFLEKGTLAKVFPCQFCETFKSNLFTEDLWVTGS